MTCPRCAFENPPAISYDERGKMMKNDAARAPAHVPDVRATSRKNSAIRPSFTQCSTLSGPA